MVQREMVATVSTAVGVIALVAGLSGCSSHSSKATTKVTIGGQDQHVHGDVGCATKEDSMSITIGDPESGVVATLTDAAAPDVLSVVFGNVDGSQFMYIKDMPTSGQPADTKATKDGKHYLITGTVSKLEDVAHPASKPFAIDVTCP